MVRFVVLCSKMFDWMNKWVNESHSILPLKTLILNQENGKINKCSPLPPKKQIQTITVIISLTGIWTFVPNFIFECFSFF